MKKIMIFAAACAALVACSKEAETVADANHFEKGQEVTLTVKAGESSTRVSSALNKDDGSIAFKWQSGDKIKVIVGEKSSEFIVSKLIGEGESAEFKGTMPGSGSKFDVQYPLDAPDIKSQTYSSTDTDILPHDMMLFTATDCNLEEEFALRAQNAALRLNLWGTKQTISKIVVTNKTTSATYTLNISPAVTLSTDSSNPTPFFVVVPAGNYSFSAEVINDGTASSSSPVTPPADAIQNGVFTVGGTTNVFTTSSAKEVTAGKILNMSAKQVSVTLLTKVYFSKGNLYYDKTGDTPAFKFEDTQYAYTSSYDANHVCRFRWAKNSGTLTDDISSAISTGTSLDGSSSDVFFTNETQTTPRSDFAVNGVSNKWRTLSGCYDEWSYLLNSRPGVTVGTTSGCRYAEVKVNSICGLLIFPDTFTWPSEVSKRPSTFNKCSSNWNSNNYSVEEFTKLQNAGCVFLPAAGCRDGSSLYDVGSQGRYWSSKPSSRFSAYILFFYYSYVSPEYYSYCYRNYGFSVRLVCAAQ